MIRHSQSTSGKYQQGLSYLEILIATVLVAVALEPAIEALHPAIQGAGIHKTQAELHYHLSSRLESLLAESFVTLDAEAQALADPSAISTVFSDTAGSTNRRLVFVSRYDANNADADNDPFTGIDEELIWIRVEVENTSHVMETLLSAHD